MKIDPKQFKTAVRGRSDKFSWNLYRFLQKYSHFDISVIRLNWCPMDGITSADRGRFYICLDLTYDDPILTGNSIIRIMCQGPKETVCIAKFGERRWYDLPHEDVTEWFFREYADKGRCIVTSFGHDWIQINSSARKCKNCGKHERRTVETRREWEREEVWA